MKFNILKRAFSLTELLIVLVVVAVLFAAMAPIMTKRGRGQTTANEPVWMYVKDDAQKSAFYDPGSSGITATAYVGLDPKTLTGNHKPYSKMVLRAGHDWQNLIQFRTGNDGDGTLAGVFAATPESRGMNMVLGSRMKGDAADNYNTLLKNGLNENYRYNSIVGMNAATKMNSASSSTVVGASSSMGGVNNSQLASMVAVGANSNLYSKALEGTTVVGSNAVKSEKTNVRNTVALGANVLGIDTSSGKNNVFVGYNVASVGFDAAAQGNVVLNSSYYGTTPKNNVIIGYKTYEAGAVDAKNLTAIGYNACSSFSTNANGSTTCIGFNSASNYGTQNTTKDFGWEEDEFEHIFLGGKPGGGLPGRSIMEIHNIPTSNKNTAYPKNIGPTVVLNSNLVVRGNLYVPNSETGQVSAFTYFPVTIEKGSEKGKVTCRRCFLARRKWKTKNCSQWWKIIIGVIIAAVAIGFLPGLGELIAAELLAEAIIGTILVGAGIGSGFIGADLIGQGLNSLKAGKDFYRGKDPGSYTGLHFQYSHNPLGPSVAGNQCTSSYAPYFTASYCPNVLKTSDLRLKENITPNSVALSKILQVNPYYYTYKADANKTQQVGVMAQDLEKYFINSVSTGADGYKSIRWDEMFFATINSIKSLDDSVNKLDAEILVMESDVDTVKKDQKSIKKRIKDIDERITKLENK